MRNDFQKRRDHGDRGSDFRRSRDERTEHSRPQREQRGYQLDELFDESSSDYGGYANHSQSRGGYGIGDGRQENRDNGFAPRWTPQSYIQAGGSRGFEGNRQQYRPETPRTMPKNYTRSDERIHEDVCEQLSRSGYDVSDVSVEVSGGKVILEGTVNNRAAKHAIEDCADDCTGVRDVENRIRVQRDAVPGASKPDDPERP